MKNNENFSICSKCQGHCCKTMPGINHPDDFGYSKEKEIERLLKSGFYAIDWYEGDPREGHDEFQVVYYIRPATIEGKRLNRIMDPSWGGQCVLLNENGCSLKFEERPLACRKLKPNPEFTTKGCQGEGKEDHALSWIKYQKMICRIIKRNKFKSKY